MAIPQNLINLAKQRGTQFNYLFPGGDVLPAAINPGEAATIDIRQGVVGAGNEDLSMGFKEVRDFAVALGASSERGGGGGVVGRNEPLGAQIASQLAQGITPTAILPTPQDSFSQPLSQRGYTPEQIAELNAGRPVGAPGTSATQPVGLPAVASTVPPTAPPSAQPVVPQVRPPITSVADLTTNVEITALETKIKEQSAEIKAGIAGVSRKTILTQAFEQFGVAEETKLLQDYNKQILDLQQRLRKIPDDIKTTLENVGVTDAQLNRLIVKETQKPLETLRDVMEQKGAAQERINQSLKFVELFANAQLQDEAAKVEAMKFDLETSKDLLGKLDDKQKLFLDITLDERKSMLEIANNAAKNGAPTDTITNILNSNSSEEALSKVGQYGRAPIEKFSEPFVQEGSIFQRNLATGEIKRIGEVMKPDTQIITETDAQGNVTSTVIDKQTGEIISQTPLGAVGKAEKETAITGTADINEFKAFFPGVDITTASGQKQFLDWKARTGAAERKGEGEPKPTALTSEDRRTLIGSNLSDAMILNIEEGVRTIGIDAVLQDDYTEDQKKAIQKVYGKEVKEVTQTQILQAAQAMKQGDVENFFTARYTEDELNKFAKEAGFAGFFKKRTTERADYLASPSARTKLAELLAEQYKEQGFTVK